MPPRPTREGCAFNLCDRTHYAKGYCNPHWRQARRGSTLKPLGQRRAMARAATAGFRRVKRGYIIVPRNSTWAYEHRVVMEGLIGRPLRAGEQVHHINGVKTDNRPENLELWATSQPYGQRACDLLAWAREIIDTYEPIADRLQPTEPAT